MHGIAFVVMKACVCFLSLFARRDGTGKACNQAFRELPENFSQYLKLLIQSGVS